MIGQILNIWASPRLLMHLQGPQVRSILLFFKSCVIFGPLPQPFHMIKYVILEQTLVGYAQILIINVKENNDLVIALILINLFLV